MVRRAARTDENQKVIVDALRKAGCLVESLAAVGCGVADLLVACRAVFGHRRLILMEIKDGDKSPSRRRLTPAQVGWHETWGDAPLVVVETVEDALEAVK